jgi:peptidoglycan/LPS O-acetylase OafA/YrhL
MLETPVFVAAPPARNDGIDLLRGLSILLVVMHHVGLRIPLHEGVLASVVPVRVLKALVYNGAEAVFVFFVVSGFLITTHSLRRWGSPGAIVMRDFYARRFARIAPCLVALLVVLSTLHLAHVPDYVIASRQSLPGAIAAACLLYLNWYEGLTGYLPGGWDVLWSLSIEEAFYLGFPIACRVARRRWSLAALLVPLALSLPVTRAALSDNEIWQEKAYLPGMAAIATGVVAALLAASVRPPHRFVPAGLSAIGATGLVVVLGYEDLLWPTLGNGSLLVLTGATAMLVLGFHWGARPPAGTAWLRALGRASYEVYLTHMFVVFALVRVFRATGGDLRWGVLWYVPAIALSWLLGAVVERHLSTPANAWLRRRLIGAPGPAEG